MREVKEDGQGKESHGQCDSEDSFRGVVLDKDGEESRYGTQTS